MKNKLTLISDRLAASQPIPGTEPDYIAPKTGLYYQVDVSGLIKGWLKSPETNHGICISDTGTFRKQVYTMDKRYYSSSRTEHPPQITLYWMK